MLIDQSEEKNTHISVLIINCEKQGKGEFILSGPDPGILFGSNLDPAQNQILPLIIY